MQARWWLIRPMQDRLNLPQRLRRKVWEVADAPEAPRFLRYNLGIPGNERADELAKEGAVEDQPENSVSFSEQKTIIKALMRPRTNRDDYHTTSREQQVNLIRLRTGHNRLNPHMNRKFKLAPSPTCACGQEDQTAEHILQRCPSLDEERKEVWPSPTPLQTKLYGSRQELEKTTTFITSAGLIV
ncbi:hypothetical protein V1264_021661 [Littorina saxatilis]|uniref:RNase H type-1 domain-containing protein n=2 Tax=Littorina saxatilis TaxID=31220 RepID=A0AAN9AIP4_9CAEN